MKHTAAVQKRRFFMDKMKIIQFSHDNSLQLRVITTNMNKNIPEHSHDFIELVFFAEGAAIHSVRKNNRMTSYPVMQGDCFTILPSEIHSFDNGNTAFYYNVIFSPSLIKNEIQELKEFESWPLLFDQSKNNVRSKIHLNLNDRMEVQNCILKLNDKLKQKNKGYKILCRGLLLELLLKILCSSPKKMFEVESDTKLDNRILSVINEMEKHPEKHYTLSDFAKKSNMCISGFSHKFHTILGMPPFEYLLSLRIEKAECLLKSSSMSIYDIAEQCGFYDVNYFIKVFRRFHNTTPAKFRKMQN